MKFCVLLVCALFVGIVLGEDPAATAAGEPTKENPVSPNTENAPGQNPPNPDPPGQNTAGANPPGQNGNGDEKPVETPTDTDHVGFFQRIGNGVGKTLDSVLLRNPNIGS